ncbi:hypothetical protein O4H61_04935 [Roseovarius aestuarii]|nr:hypothetical protein [Roseovarius aestuarii]
MKDARPLSNQKDLKRLLLFDPRSYSQIEQVHLEICRLMHLGAAPALSYAVVE